MTTEPEEHDEELEEEEEDEETCYRCGTENPKDEDWSQNYFNSEVFCESCFFDRDKYGYPYMTDLHEMTDNPYNYLPHGY